MNAFAAAIQAGADADNLAAIGRAGPKEYDAVIPRTVAEGIRHNKFMVLMRGDEPLAVWTGSTNIFAWDLRPFQRRPRRVGQGRRPEVSGLLGTARKNLTPTKLRGPVRTATPTPAGTIAKNSVAPLFSPRDDKDSDLARAHNPLNSNNYIHTKFMLVDPLGDDPLVVSGSANFSRPSQRINDENMLVIRGETRVADICCRTRAISRRRWAPGCRRTSTPRTQRRSAAAISSGEPAGDD